MLGFGLGLGFGMTLVGVLLQRGWVEGVKPHGVGGGETR